MFRRSSKKDKEGVSKITSAVGSENGVKRGSRLFSFGKRDKKKSETYSPHPNGTSGGGSHLEADDTTVSSLQPLVEESKHLINENSSKISNPQTLSIQNFSSVQRQISSPSSSYSYGLVDFGTDSSFFLQNFAADVLKATEDKLKGVDLKLPELKETAPEESSRTVFVKRGPAGDFGIALRRSTLKKGNTKIIHLVEPTNEKHTLGLLPGDRLVEVDGINVENFSREEIIDKVSNAGDSVRLKVAPVPELSELSSRSLALQSTSLLKRVPTLTRSGSVMRKASNAMRKVSRSEKEVVKPEKDRSDSEKVWVMHQSGFSSGCLNKVKDEHGDIVSHKVKMDHGGEVVEVDEGFVDKINPPEFDQAEDLSSLPYLNESACLHTLRQRYGGNLIHTYAGNSLVIVKPEETLHVYNHKVMKMFQGCKQEDMPPHIFAVAQTSYRAMLASNMNQSIVLRGNAGSGKTFNMKQILKYLTTIAVTSDSCLTTFKIEAALSLLQSFTHARTILSRDASFARLLYTLNFNSLGLLIGCSIQNFFLDKARVARPPLNETSYHIFYELLNGCSGKLQQEFMLDSLKTETNILFNLKEECSCEDSFTEKWKKLGSAVEALSVSDEEWRGVLAPIAAILHLGAAGITTAPGTKAYFANSIFAQKAASILGTTEENITRLLFTSRKRSSSNLSRSNSVSSYSASISENGIGAGDPISPSNSAQSVSPAYDIALNALEGFISGLYIEAFNALMRLVNRALNTSLRVTSILNVFDSPGFQNKTPINETGTFEDLCTNYCCEKLHWLTYYCMFTAQMDRYSRENIDCSYEVKPSDSPEITLSAIDKLSGTSRTESYEAKGLFWIIEEEALKLNSNPVILVDKIKNEHKSNRVSSVVMTDSGNPELFIVSHHQNTMPIKYNTSGWLRRIREHPNIKAAYGILTESSKTYVSELYTGHQSGAFQSESSHGLRRKPRAILANMKKNSISMQMRNHMDRIIELLDRTTIRFVYCFLPRLQDSLCDGTISREAQFDIPCVRQQLKNSNLIEIMRLHRQGYPDHMSFPDFSRRFNILVENEDKETTVLDSREAVSSMVKKLELEERSFKIGLSQIFFRPGILPPLEDYRDEKLSVTLTEFQALSRGYLSRKRLEKLRVQHLAIRCIQKNVRNFIHVRHWCWWRLYTKVLPLLDVHRTEQELQTKSTEVSSLNVKLKTLEEQNIQFTDENSRLKKKIQELSSQLSDIHSSASGADELLDQETLERMRLEEELERSKMETERLSKQCDILESELSEAKLSVISNGLFNSGSDIDSEELEENDNIWRQKYTALSRELESTRRTLTNQAEEEIQELMNQKRATEKALATERADGDDVRRQLANSKRKLNKINAEMDDMKLLLESLQCRNSDLEKRQRKFDQEMEEIYEQFESEKSRLQKCQRESDKLANDKLNLQNDSNEKEYEINQLKMKVVRLDEEIKEFGKSGKADVELVNLRRQLRESEAKLQDQEEELDEQAGKIQQLEQTKMRLEMAAMREKQQIARDMDAKDEELEKVKLDFSRKLRALNEQIEDEVKRKEDLNKVKRELERKVFDLEGSVDTVDNGNERRLKKDLKRMKHLYKDAKLAMESQVINTSQTEVKTLRNQLDDAEFAKHMALKAKTQIEEDLAEYQSQIDNLTKAKENIDAKCLALQRDNGDLQARIDDMEDEMDAVIRSNKMLVSQLADAQNSSITVKEINRKLDEEIIAKIEKINFLTKKLESAVNNKIEKTDVERLEVKISELEAKLENEGATRIKHEHLVNRLRSQLERSQDECSTLHSNQNNQQMTAARFERQIKEYRSEIESVKRQESDHKRRREELENEVQTIAEELSRKKTELKMAEKRIRDLQEALEEGVNSSDDDSLLDELDESDNNSLFSSRRRGSSNRYRQSLSKRNPSETFNKNTSAHSSYRSQKTSSSSYNGKYTVELPTNSYSYEREENLYPKTNYQSVAKPLRQSSID